jgi:hypothetical protein
MQNRKFLKSQAPFRLLILATFAAVLLCPVPARATAILSLQSVIANSPSAGNEFDVVLTNTGPTSITLGAFLFELTTSDTNITFTSATTATILFAYVFSGHSLFGPTISTSGPGQLIDASDNFDTPGAGAVIGAGISVGLGHILFDVAPGDTAGPKTVNFTAFPSTALSDNLGNNITFTATPGTITIASSSVPEPSTLMMAMLGFPVLAWARKRLR